MRQIVDWWNERGLEGWREGTNGVICGTPIVNYDQHQHEERWGPSRLIYSMHSTIGSLVTN